MKRIIGLLALSLLIGSTFAQSISQINVPSVVLNSFQLSFPNADDVEWKIKKGNYRVKFEINNKDNEIILDNKGNLLKHVQDLYSSEIPKSVLETIKSRVKFFDIKDAERLNESSTITYHIRLKVDGKEHNFWMNDTGFLLKHRAELRKSKIPADIISQIEKEYGEYEIDKAKFVEEGKRIMYILRGEINDKYHFFMFNDKTTIIKHIQDLDNDEIPIPIKKGVKKAYADYEIKDADLIEEAGKVNYELELRKSKNKIYVRYSPDGKFLKVR